MAPYGATRGPAWAAMRVPAMRVSVMQVVQGKWKGRFLHKNQVVNRELGEVVHCNKFKEKNDRS